MLWLYDAAHAADWIALTEFMFVKDIDSDAARLGVLLGIDTEGDVLGLQAG